MFTEIVVFIVGLVWSIRRVYESCNAKFGKKNGSEKKCDQSFKSCWNQRDDMSDSEPRHSVGKPLGQCLMFYLI